MHTLSPKCIHYPQNAYINIEVLRIEVQISPVCIYYPRFEESTKYFQTVAPRIGAGEVFKNTKV